MKTLFALTLGFSFTATVSLFATDPAPKPTTQGTFYDRFFGAGASSSRQAAELSAAAGTTAALQIPPESALLTGNFRVTAAGGQRAVLRRVEDGSARIVVNFTNHTPVEGEQISFSAAQKIRIIDIRMGNDGQFTVYANEPKNQL